MHLVGSYAYCGLLLVPKLFLCSYCSTSISHFSLSLFWVLQTVCSYTFTIIFHFFLVALRPFFGSWAPISRPRNHAHLDTLDSVGLLWMNDQPDAGIYNFMTIIIRLYTKVHFIHHKLNLYHPAEVKLQCYLLLKMSAISS